MTEAMSRREIEDVLSSIRRLVSHDPARVQRPDQLDAPGTNSTADAASAKDTLVLTSALRVDAKTTTGPNPRRVHIAAEGNVENNGASRTAFPQDPEAPKPDMNLHAAPVTLRESVGNPGFDTPRDGAVPLTKLNLTPQPDPVQGAAAEAELPSIGLLRTRAALERLEITGAKVEKTEAVEVSAPEAVEPEPRRNPVDAQGFEPQANVHLAATENHADAASDLPDHLAEDVLETTLARLEQALSASPRSSDMSGGSVTDAPPNAGAGQNNPLSDTKGNVPVSQQEEDAIIDEAALRQIVADIVRQELQGELGERITRNIRKLVRAEVGRELQLRQLQ